MDEIITKNSKSSIDKTKYIIKTRNKILDFIRNKINILNIIILFKINRVIYSMHIDIILLNIINDELQLFLTREFRLEINKVTKTFLRNLCISFA